MHAYVNVGTRIDTRRRTYRHTQHAQVCTYWIVLVYIVPIKKPAKSSENQEILDVQEKVLVICDVVDLYSCDPAYS